MHWSVARRQLLSLGLRCLRSSHGPMRETILPSIVIVCTCGHRLEGPARDPIPSRCPRCQEPITRPRGTAGVPSGRRPSRLALRPMGPRDRTR